MEKQNLIYFSETNNNSIEVVLENETIWLSLNQIATLFERDKSVISKHIKKIFLDEELVRNSVVAFFATTAKDGKSYNVEYFNLDVIISVGYKVNSKRGTEFRQWATKRLSEYLINDYKKYKKLALEKENEIKHLKSSLKVFNRTLENQISSLEEAKEIAKLLEQFSDGLTLLDDYDHNNLDRDGNSNAKAEYVSIKDYSLIINEMKTEFTSELFGKEKDNSFGSSINQIYQSFDDKDLYPTIEEKAAMLLYLIVKNHSFIDGNKRIAAACFLFFLNKNNILYINNKSIISNYSLATLTLLIAESKPEERETIIKLVVSILNRKITNI